MTIETKEQQYLRRIATALEKLVDIWSKEALSNSILPGVEKEYVPHLHRNLIDFCEESKSKMWAEMSKNITDGINDALVDTKKQDGVDCIKSYAQEVKAYCKNTDCDFCTLCDDDLCLLGHSVPENWEV